MEAPKIISRKRKVDTSPKIKSRSVAPKRTKLDHNNDDYDHDNKLNDEKSKTVSQNIDSCTSIHSQQSGLDIWDEAEMLSQVEKIPQQLAKNLIGLLNEGCTLPFIARYRKTAVYNLFPERLQELHQTYESITQLKKKVKSVIETLKKSKKLTPEVEKGIVNARSLSELDLIYAPLKSHSLSLAERARNLGLEPYGIQALNGEYIDLTKLCTDSEELSSVEKVEAHVTHIVADIIYKDTRVLEQMRSLKEETRFSIQSTRTKSSTKEKKANETKKHDTKSDPETYKIYFEWKCPSLFVKPHQTLALNRGEDEKILSIKVVVPDWFYNRDS